LIFAIFSHFRVDFHRLFFGGFALSCFSLFRPYDL
jgi:hypothetical protein